MKKLTVGLVDLGERLPLKLNVLAKTMNSLQTALEFDDAGVITSDAMGEPDVDGKWYDIPRLAELVRKESDTRYDYLVGFTNCRITHTEEQPPSAERDYFSRSDFEKIAIISVNKTLTKHHSPGKSILQFAAFLLIAEVVIMAAKRNLTHYNNIHCVFNECEDRDLLAGCIESGEICPSCVMAIKRANVPDRILEGARSVLAWCKRTSWQHAVGRTLQHPITGLALGVGIGWFTAIFVTKERYPVMLAVTLVPVAVTLFLTKKAHA